MAVTAVWGLDIGQCALKAVKARLSGELVRVLAFDHIEYKKPLSTAGVDPNATIREALQTFLSRNDVEGCSFSVSIAAGRAALIRFIKLPPVDRRKVPDIVRYEATQQIPFPLEDVIWDHQVIDRQYAPGEELEVGIFAMRREAIFDYLSNLMVSGVEVENIQLAAVSLYNCVRYDQPTEDGAVMAVDIGAENTNLVVVDGNTVWTRSLPIGGNDFTRAIATKYSMDFDQAENLKRNMDKSKKAQEIFEALRPSLRSLLDEIQRSAGYYRSTHKSSKFVKLLGFGGGFRMYGVPRFLEAGLAYPVEVFEKTNNMVVDGAVNLQFFKKAAPSFGPALGLVIQGLRVGGINTTLMPPTIIRERLLKKKRPFLVAAAALLGMAFAWPALSAYTMPTKYEIAKHPVAQTIRAKEEIQRKYEGLIDVKEAKGGIQRFISLKDRRAEHMNVLNSLIATFTQAQASPLYVNRIALVVGDENSINQLLMKPKVEGALEAVASIFTPDRVERPKTIDAASVDKTKQKAQGAAVDRDERIDKMETLRAKQEADRSDRLAAFAQKSEEKRLTNVKGTQRSDLKLKFPDGGPGYIANVFVETTDPRGVAYLRDICGQAKRNLPGVVYCECVFATDDTYWENPDTHARLYNEPAIDLAQIYKETKYTTAVLQWVFKPGFTEQQVLVRQAAPPAGAQAPKPAAGIAPQAEAQEEPMPEE